MSSEPELAILVRAEDRLTPIAPRHEVVERPGVLHTATARHTTNSGLFEPYCQDMLTEPLFPLSFDVALILSFQRKHQETL